MDWPTGKYGAILVDPPWRFETWGSQDNASTYVERHYKTLTSLEIKNLPVSDLAADDCVLFLWITWPTLLQAIDLISSWKFQYKTCGFAWFKGDSLPLFPEDMRGQMGCGYWTRSNSEVCLLATRGKPKRLDAGVRQAILEPRREHSRKPDCVHERIERLVAGPYLELFARAQRPGWVAWGNETEKFAESA